GRLACGDTVRNEPSRVAGFGAAFLRGIIRASRRQAGSPSLPTQKSLPLHTASPCFGKSLLSTVIPLSQPGSPADTRRAARSSTWVKVASASNRWRTWLSAYGSQGANFTAGGHELGPGGLGVPVPRSW